MKANFAYDKGVGFMHHSFKKSKKHVIKAPFTYFAFHMQLGFIYVMGQGHERHIMVRASG
jgi:hypothetical protein